MHGLSCAKAGKTPHAELFAWRRIIPIMRRVLLMVLVLLLSVRAWAGAGMLVAGPVHDAVAPGAAALAWSALPCHEDGAKAGHGSPQQHASHTAHAGHLGADSQADSSAQASGTWNPTSGTSDASASAAGNATHATCSSCTVCHLGALASLVWPLALTHQPQHFAPVGTTRFASALAARHFKPPVF